MIGAAENVILALSLTISLEVSLIAKCDSDALFGCYLLIFIFQQSKVKPTRTVPEGQELKDSSTKRKGKAQHTPVAPSGSESKMQMAVQKKACTESGKFRSDYSDEVKELTIRWALVYLTTEPANNQSRWYAKLPPEFWDKHHRGPRVTMPLI